MKVFISWSGSTSKEVALVLRNWLQFVLHHTQPWMSETDVQKGSRWFLDLSSELEATRYGIVCLTPDNLDSAWIFFEAGAIAKTLPQTYLIPFLSNIKFEDLPEPLKQFQAVRANEQREVKGLIENMNKALGENALPDKILHPTFDRWWPVLQEELEKIRQPEMLISENLPPRKAIAAFYPASERDVFAIADRLEQSSEGLEAVYIYEARRYGVGHGTASFECEINKDGSAQVRRVLQVEAYSTVSSLDTFLLFPEDVSSIDGLQPVIALESLSADREIRLDDKKFRMRRLTGELSFHPSLRAGDRAVYKLIEQTSTPVFTLGYIKTGQWSEKITHEFFGWSVSRPTRRLQLKILLPKDEEPVVYSKEVRRSTTSGFDTTPILHEELKRLSNPSLIVAKDGRVSLSMDIAYPMIGLTYLIRWEPRQAA